MRATAKWAFVIHGGAGAIERASMNRETETAYRAALTTALETGATILREGGTALDAVETSIRFMEDDPLFNAGRGAVFSSAGRNELDASVMDGRTLNAGAVAAVLRTRHPITLARRVMEKSSHVMLTGDGADAFAEQQGLEIVPPSFFFTQRRWQELERTLTERGDPLPNVGTVGAVAFDTYGNIAAGTSTGGITGKRWGRVGDSPIIGAGTYASNDSCGVSCTGEGEYFIRLTIAREICALVEYKNYNVQVAADELIQKRLTALNGTGGVIVVSPKGEMAWSFNTSGMYRARISAATAATISIFKDEP